MRESIGTTWVMQLMFGFILLFVSFLAVTISYSKSFKIKNEITSIIEKYGGFNNYSYNIINGYLQSVGHFNDGKCTSEKNSNILGVNNLSVGSKPEEAVPNKRYYYCVKKEQVNTSGISNIYYEITTFYKFNLPVVGNITTFSIKGKTTDLTKYRGNDCFEADCQQRS